MVVRQGFFKRAICASIGVALAGCASQRSDVSHQPTGIDTFESTVSTSLLEGKPAEARDAIADVLRGQPQNGYYHLLNGLSYQVEGNSLQSLGLAKVGYDAAVKFTPGHFWSQYFAGAAALDLQDYGAAGEYFSAAILDDPDRPLGFLGLAVAAYYAGDLDVAQAAADRALTLAPQNRSMLRTAAYVAAARGDRQHLDDVWAKAEAVPDAARDLALQQPRLNNLLRVAALAQPAAEQSAGRSRANSSPGRDAEAAKPAAADHPNQVMVEVTLLLNQNSTATSTGINLLDGLAVQFGLNYVFQEVTGTDPTTIARTLTSAIKVPEITYSLNLFNTKEDFYRVITRPSLVASLNEESEFFIGRTVSVGVSGINMGTVQPIDVGTVVRVTPRTITRDETKFKVEVVRSFIAANTAGSFTESLTTFKQVVGATAEVKFGTTLVLSGLYEGVDFGTTSKTPLLGDTPGLDTLFNARTRTQRRDVALVLVTPRLTGVIETETREFRGETLAKLLSLWNEYIDPTANLDAILGGVWKVKGPGKYFGAQAADLHVLSASDPDTVRAAVHDTIAQLR